MSTIPGHSLFCEIPICSLPPEFSEAVASPFQDLLRDPSVPREFLLVATPRDGSAGVSVYFSTGGYHSLTGDTPERQLFKARLLTPYSYRVNLFGSGRLATGRRTLPGAGSLVLANPTEVSVDGTGRRSLLMDPGELDELFGYNWDRSDLEVRLGARRGVGERYHQPLSQFTTIWAAKASDVSGDSRELEVHANDLQELFNDDIQRRLYYGLNAALRFDGSTTWGTANTGKVGSVTDGVITIEAWVHPRAEATGGPYTLFGKRLNWQLKQMPSDDANSPDGIRLIYHDATTRYRWSWDGFFAASGGHVGEHHHIAFVLDGSFGATDCKFYLDGELQPSSDHYATDPTPAVYTHEVTFGALDAAGNEKWQGDLDEIRAWQEARTREQIRAHMKRELSTDEAASTGLLCYWNLNEAAGTEAFGPDQPRQRYIDCTTAAGGYATVPDDALLDPSELTVEAWVYPVSTGGAAHQGVVDKGGNSGWRLRVTTDGKLHFLDRGFTNPLVTGAGVVSVNRWTHVAATAGAAGIFLYVDGELVVSGGDAYGAPSTESALEIGGNLTGVELLDGYIDDVRIWDHVRTEQELSDHRLEHLSGFESGLVANWKLNEQTGTVLADASPNDLDGALNTAAWASTIAALTGGPYWVSMYEGGSDVAGKPKPLTYGRAPHREAHLIDRFWNIWQVHDGSCQSIVAYDGGQALTSAGDVADLYDDSLPPAGQYRTDLSRGLVQLGTLATTVLTCTVEGDDDGGYVEDAAGIIARIADDRLADPVTRDLTAFAQLALDLPGRQLFVTDLAPVQIGAAFDRLLASRGWWSLTRTGELTAGVLQDPSAQAAELKLGPSDVLLGAVKRLRPPKVSWRESVGYVAAVHQFSQDELNASLSLSDRHELMEGTLYVPADDDDVLEPHPGALDVRTETNFVDRDDALREAGTRQALFGVDRQGYEVPLRVGILQHQLGKIVILTLPRFQLSAGRNLAVVGLDERIAAGRTDSVKLVCWG